MSQALKKEEVVPDVIDEVPANVVEVKYGNAEVSDGKALTPTQVFELPTHVSWKTDPNSFYTLCLTDPDAPSRQKPERREFLHWLVYNIPGCDLAKGETLVEYVPSGPPQGTGYHRYIFVVYQQPGKIKPDEAKVPDNSAEPRRHFSIRKFAAKYNLTLVAANFYQAEYDETVPKVHQKFKR